MVAPQEVIREQGERGKNRREQGELGKFKKEQGEQNLLCGSREQENLSSGMHEYVPFLANKTKNVPGGGPLDPQSDSFCHINNISQSGSQRKLGYVYFGDVGCHSGLPILLVLNENRRRELRGSVVDCFIAPKNCRFGLFADYRDYSCTIVTLAPCTFTLLSSCKSARVSNLTLVSALYHIILGVSRADSCTLAVLH